MAPTSPIALVLTTSESHLSGRKLQVQRVPHLGDGVKVGSDPQNIPRAALASSDIISGLHAGRSTISGRTSPIPSRGARNARI